VTPFPADGGPAGPGRTRRHPFRAAAIRPAWPRPPAAVTPRLVIPAYFHPAAAPEDWARMARQAAQIRLVILNPASGAGDAPDPDYLAAVAPLHEAGIDVAGYVDTNYGQRPSPAILADIRRYLDWYGVAGVMFDRVPAGPADLHQYAILARETRKLGARLVLFNHGVHPHQAYARHADILGTFEGPWNVYLQQAVPRWTRGWPADRFYHVVYSVPPAQLPNAFLMAGRRRAGCVYVTDDGGGNPYRRLPAAPPAPTAAHGTPR
jgi:Spherulation-specific family 4